MFKIAVNRIHFQVDTVNQLFYNTRNGLQSKSTVKEMSAVRTNKKRNYAKGLDLLRGIAIIGIVLYHLFPSVFEGGFLGVPLFFVLSGYLMFVTSDIRFQKGKFSIGKYYKKRILKIFPALFTMVMVVCCYLTLFCRSRLIGIQGEIASIFFGYNNWWQIGQNASYFSKMGDASLFTHLWFLAVELQFYLIWPVLFFLYQKGCQIAGTKAMSFFFPVLAFLSAGWMFFLYTPGSDPSRVYYGTDTMAFPLLIGISAGALKKQGTTFFLGKQKETSLAVLSILATCFLFFIVNGKNRRIYQGGMFVISLFFAGMVCLFESHKKILEKLPGASLLSRIGQKSYYIYLWHYPLIILAQTI